MAGKPAHGQAVYAGIQQDMSGDDGCMSAEEMVALMNNGALLMQTKGDRTVMQTGANRDADGTIDRSPPPTADSATDRRARSNVLS